ncbi:MAG: pilus assembly protein [Myxococcaceae bacterium]|nr:pilus assembly protein [Myxococcaceae bacterium]
MRRRKVSDGGQAAVESALVIPLFMFVLMGSLQLALMHQARLLTKYAAYKAVRVGALTSVDMKRMEMAALAVLLPTIAGGHQGDRAYTNRAHVVHRTRSADDFLSAFNDVKDNTMPEDGQTHYVEIMVCSPNGELLGGGDEHDFDSEGAVSSSEMRNDQQPGSQGWKDFDRGRLSIQLTYNYRMVIPFADAMLYRIFMGQDRADLMWTFRLGKQDPQVEQQRQMAQKYDNLASGGMYVFPIRANFIMRMQSSLFPNASGHELPARNDCVLRFPKLGEGGSGGSGGVVNDIEQDDEVEPE